MGLDSSMDTHIQRGHRALAPKPTKKEILGQVWRKGGQKWNNGRNTCNHDYPPGRTPLKEYAQAKTALKEKKIRFQTPCPAKVWVFCEGETVLYNQFCGGGNK